MCEADSSPTCLRPLLAGIVDYAGLFPPAALDLLTVVRNYAAYRQGEHAWMLGRLILPVARLAEFEGLAAATCAQGDNWPISALSSATTYDEYLAEFAALAAFNQRWQGRAQIDAYEFKPVDQATLADVLAHVPSGLATYAELAPDETLPSMLAVLSDCEGRAKLRTGGVTAAAFPTTGEVAGFLHACAAADVPFKATAGLHHPLRSEQKLTYADDSPCGTMHGFLNVFSAAAFAQDGASVTELTAILEEHEISAFRFERDALFWRKQMLVKPHLVIARRMFALSFGSCSFTEPIEDLHQLGLL